MDKETPAKNASLALDVAHAAYLANIFVVYNQKDTT